MATLHQVAVGIQELHRAKIAHQDVKRSNVVFFGEQRDSVKLIDLGRAVKRDRPSRNDQRVVPASPSMLLPNACTDLRPPIGLKSILPQTYTCSVALPIRCSSTFR